MIRLLPFPVRSITSSGQGLSSLQLELGTLGSWNGYMEDIWTKKWTDKYMNGCLNKWTDRCINGQIDV